MMAKPIRTLELHYPLIQFLIIIHSLYDVNNIQNCIETTRPSATLTSTFIN